MGGDPTTIYKSADLRCSCIDLTQTPSDTKKSDCGDEDSGQKRIRPLEQQARKAPATEDVEGEEGTSPKPKRQRFLHRRVHVGRVKLIEVDRL